MSNELQLNIDVYEYINPNAFINFVTYKNALNIMKNNNLTTLDILMLSRYTYNMCEETLLDDKTYDYILRFKEFSHLSEQLYEQDNYRKYLPIIKQLGLRINKRDYGIKEEDDPIPYEKKMELLAMFDSNSSLMTLTDKSQVRNRYFEPYKGNYNAKMQTKEDGCKELTEEIFNKYGINPSKQVVTMSYKHDGWNITAYYIPEQTKLAYAHTRGRDGAEVTDCTFLLKDILPEMKVEEPTKVVMELVLSRENLDYLRSKYIDKTWTNIRNSVSTFVAGHIEVSDYKRISYRAFNIIGSKYESMSLPEKLEILAKNGFDIPYAKFTTVDNFEALIDYMEKYYDEVYSKEFECDGLVFNMDFYRWFIEDGKMYYKKDGSALCAYKGDIWDSEILETEIEEIYLGRSKKNFTPKARLKPVQSRSGSMLSNVSLNNLRMIQEYWLMPGDRIKIKYHSQQIVLFVDKISGASKEEYLKEHKDELILE